MLKLVVAFSLLLAVCSSQVINSNNMRRMTYPYNEQWTRRNSWNNDDTMTRNNIERNRNNIERNRNTIDRDERNWNNIDWNREDINDNINWQPRILSSCWEILNWYPETISGLYWINDGVNSMRRIYCDMDRFLCGGRGWERFYTLDLINNRDQMCPGEFIRDTMNTSEGLNLAACRRRDTTNKCTNAEFNLNNRNYYEICFKIGGYQKGLPNAFNPYSSNTDERFMDGITISHGEQQRHLWSYVVGAHRDMRDIEKIRNKPRDLINLCPDIDNSYSWNHIPFFIGNNYYCDSGLSVYDSSKSSTYYDIIHGDRELWRGMGCNPNEYSCRRSGQPWFYRRLATPIEDKLMINSCYEDSTSDVWFNNIEIFLR